MGSLNQGLGPDIISTMLDQNREIPVKTAEQQLQDLLLGTVEPTEPEALSQREQIIGAISAALQGFAAGSQGRATGPTAIQRLQGRRQREADVDTALRQQQRQEKLGVAQSNVSAARRERERSLGVQEDKARESRGRRERKEALGIEQQNLKDTQRFRLQAQNPFLRLPAGFDVTDSANAGQLSSLMENAAKREAQFKESLRTDPKAADRAFESSDRFLTQLRTMAFGGADQDGNRVADLRTTIANLKNDELVSESRSTRAQIESLFRTTGFVDESAKQEAQDLMLEINDVFDVELEKRGLLPSGARNVTTRTAPTGDRGLGRGMFSPDAVPVPSPEVLQSFQRISQEAESPANIIRRLLTGFAE